LGGSIPEIDQRGWGLKSVTVLGSTGSIGVNTVDLIARSEQSFRTVALTGNRNIDLLARQAIDLNAEFVVTADGRGYKKLKDLIGSHPIEVAAGSQAVTEAAERSADVVIAGIVGAAALEPTLAAARRGATIGLANKESLVCAGDLMTEEIRKSGARIIPVDSEHNAIFQVFDFKDAHHVQKIILTASGGPFRDCSLEHMKTVGPAQAVAHPNWDMGAKISVDSATMMNKGLELIEAFHLFPVEEEQIDIVVHPQSVIHSMVSYVDGSVLAQMGTPDMRTPISYALAWPERMATGGTPLSLPKIRSLTFEEPDFQRFPALRLARNALKKGGGAPTVLNAANEVAVGFFLNETIGFLDIVSIVEKTLERVGDKPLEALADVFALDEQARRIAGEIASQAPTLS